MHLERVTLCICKTNTFADGVRPHLADNGNAYLVKFVPVLMQLDRTANVV